MKYRIVRLGRDFPGKITDFAEARNSFLGREWILFVDDDEEPSKMLIDYLDGLEPKFPWYQIRRINLSRGKYVNFMNPDTGQTLCGPSVRFAGRRVGGVMMEGWIEPWDPHGVIDYPIIHDHQAYDWECLPRGLRWRLKLAKTWNVFRG